MESKKSMLSRKNIKLLFACIVLFMFSFVAGMVALFDVRPVKAERNVQTLLGKNVTTGATLPDGIGIVDKRKGTLVTATESGTTFSFGDTFVGTFETDFRVYSDVSHDGKVDIINNVNHIKNSLYTNKYADFDELVFTFTDADDVNNSFEIVIRSGSGDCEFLPNLSVRYEGEEYGIYYDPYFGTMIYGSQNATKLRNSQGFYTQLTGSSFSNLTYRSYSEAFSAPDSTVLGFDANNMTVYTYIYIQGVKQKVTVLDLSSGFNDYRYTPVVSGFEKYTISMTCNKIKTDKAAKVLFYSINGQSLSTNDYVADSTAPALGVKTPAVVGCNKEVKVAVGVYDVVDGYSAFNGEAIAQLKGKSIPVTLQDGYVSCTPSEEGILKLELSVADKAGNIVTENREIIVVDSPFVFGYDTDISSTGTYGVGETLDYSFFNLSANYFDSDHGMFYVLSKDGTAIDGNEPKSLSTLSYQFTEEGEYTLTLSAEGYDGTLDFTYYVLNDVAGVTLSERLSESVSQNGKLTLPVATITKNGVSKTATLSILSPSGKKYSAEGFIYAEETGVYTLTYAADFDGETYSREYKVSSVRTDAFFTGNGFTETKNVTTNYFDGVSGVELSPLSDKTTVTATYSQIVDLNNFSDLEPVVKLYSQHLPDGNFGPMPKIRLTDVYDSSNYVELETVVNYDYWYGHFNIGTLVRVSSSVKTISSQGFYSHSGLNAAGAWGVPLRMFWINEDQAIALPGWEKFPVDSKQWGIYDIDPTWKGFTTGEVYVSISFDQAIVVSDIGGADLSAEGLSRDNEAPIVFVDTEGYDRHPLAVKGREYSIFDAYAYDAVSGMLDVDTAVYLDYYNSFKRIVCSNSKTFTPTVNDTYYVEYRATDAWGNVGVKVLEVQVINQEDYSDISIEFNQEHPTEIYFGEELTLPEVVACSGGTGNIEVKKTVTTPDGKVTEYQKGYAPEAEGKHTITYTLTDYIGTTKEFKYEIMVSASDKPIVKDVTLPFSYVLNGAEVVFPMTKALFASNGNISELPVKVKVVQSGKEDLILEAPYKYVPVIESEREDVSVVYFAENADGEKTELAAKHFTVVNPYLSMDSSSDDYGLFDMKKFFALSDGMTISSSNDWSYVKMDTTTDSEFHYVNRLLAKNLTLDIAVPEDAANLSYIEIVLTDSLDATQQVVVRFLRNGSSSMIQINNDPKLISATEAKFGSTAGISFGYSNNSRNVTNGTTTIYTTVNETLNGEEFNGFTSGYVYMKVALVGVTGNTTVRVLKVNGQTFSNRQNTIGKPLTEYETEKYFPTRIEIGQTLCIPKIRANCVLYGIKEVLVSARINGQNVLSDATFTDELNYTIEKDATCRIEYKAITYFGTTISLHSFNVQVTEMDPPVIEVASAPVKTAKLGSTIKLSSATATDSVTGVGTLFNKGEEDSSVTILKLFVLDPNLNKQQIYADNLTFVANKKGVWRVVYFAYDACYNIAKVEYLITVE